MKTNPFTSPQYETTWTNHFNEGEDLISFDFIKEVKFVKNSSDGIYTNAGRNLTKGIFYDLDYSKQDYKGKTFLIYDVPDYFNVDEFKPPKNSSLRLKKIFQYQGFLMNTETCKDQDEYINTRFSSKNRREFRSNKRRLEACFDISYSFIHGTISQSNFDVLFEQFYVLLNKRFADKQTNYHHLSPKKWNFYKDLVFSMLQDKKASLLVIYNEKTPIGITLNFHAEDILFEAITVFDPDYYKFSIGKTSIIKLLEWCFENNYKVSDFSKGDYDYKHKWSNVVYDFNYHVLYDSKSITSVLKATYVGLYYRLKLFLRRKKVNELYRKYKFLVKGETTEKKNKTHQNFKFENLNDFVDSELYEQIDFKSEVNSFFLQFVYTFLFANSEPEANIKAYKHKVENEYIISGTNKTQKVTFI